MTLAWSGSPLWLLVYSLCAYRLTVLWTRDSAPPLPALRQYVTTRWGHLAWTELMTCAWCSGFWIAVGTVALASSPAEPVFRWLALPLAMSAVIGLLAAVREE